MIHLIFARIIIYYQCEGGFHHIHHHCFWKNIFSVKIFRAEIENILQR